MDSYCARALARYLAVPGTRTRGDAPPVPQKDGSSFLHDLRAIPRVPLLRAILVLVLLASFLVNTGYYQFFLALQHDYAGRSQALAGFLGRFEALASLAALIMQIVIIPRAMARWGAIAGLAFFPAGMAFGALVALATGSMLWAVALTVASVPVLLNTINDAGMNVLYLPVPAAVRRRTKPLIDMLYAAVVGIAGLVFLLARQVPIWSYGYWSFLILMLAAVWIALLVQVRRHYMSALVESVSERHLDLESRALDLGDETTAQILVRTLHGEDDLLAIHVLNLIAESPTHVWDQHVAAMLSHRSAEVRIMAVRYLGRQGNAAYVEPVAALLDDEDSAVRAAAILALPLVGGADRLEQVAPFLASPEPLISGATLAGLLRWGGHAGQRSASGRLASLLAGPERSARHESARVITALASALESGDARLPEAVVHQFGALLSPLLDDPDRGVRLSAIRAVGAMRIQALLPRLVAQVGEDGTTEALVRFGQQALPFLRALLTDKGGDRGTRARVPSVLRAMGTSGAGAILLEHLDEPDDHVRSMVYRALARLVANGVVPSPGEAILGARVLNELGAYYSASAIRADLGVIGEDSLLHTILGERQDQALDRTLSLLEIWYPDRGLERVRRALDAGSGETRAMAIELLDALAERTIGELLIPPIEASEEQVVRIARQRYSLRARTAIEQLGRLALADDPWLRAAAVLCIGTLPAPALTHAAGAALAATDDLVREAALAACRMLMEQAQFLPIARAQAHDAPSPQVRRYALALSVDTHTGGSPMLSTVERVLFLKVADIFSAVTSEDLVSVALIAQEIRFSAGETLIRQGDLDDCLYAIVDGEVGVVVRGAGQVAIRRARSVIGELALLSSRPRTADCVALTDVATLRIDRGPFWELLAERPALALGLITMLSRRLEETTRVMPQADDA